MKYHFHLITICGVGETLYGLTSSGEVLYYDSDKAEWEALPMKAEIVTKE